MTQLTTNDEHDRACVETVLLHSSGQWIASRLTVPAPKADAHGAGSAITYARRYSLMAIVNVVGDEDDDGNRASAPPSKPVEVVPPALLIAAREAAMQGTGAYKAWFSMLTVEQRRQLAPEHGSLKAAAEAADGAQ